MTLTCTSCTKPISSSRERPDNEADFSFESELKKGVRECVRAPFFVCEWRGGFVESRRDAFFYDAVKIFYRDLETRISEGFGGSQRVPPLKPYAR